jgi:biopolymer transport protein ExbD/biopolymer transport protein TolR
MGVALDSSGGAKPKGATPAMNVTPLVDVVLVLLIVFMVVAPLLSKKFSLALPKQAEEKNAPAQADVPIVLTVDADGATRLNREVVPTAALGPRIAAALAAKGDKTVYFDADDAAPFGAAVRAMDTARAHGAKTVSILTAKAVD